MIDDGPKPDAVEHLPYGQGWESRFEDIRVLNRMEGGAVYSARGEGAFWIITDEGTLADFLDERDADLLESLIRLKRYDDEERWREAVEVVERKARRRYEDPYLPMMSSYEEDRARWQETFDRRSEGGKT